MAKKTYIHVGTIVRPHGVKGECCVHWYADSPELLKQNFFLHSPTNTQSQEDTDMHVRSAKHVQEAVVRLHKGRPLLTLPHVTTRTQAEALRGTEIYVHRSDLPPIDDDEAYLHDILGMTVVDVQTNKALGILENISHTAAHMIWIIRCTQKGHEGVEILFPAVEEFIDSFDTENASIYVLPPEGLLDIYFE